jgi:CHAT domain-containing protein/tetratricopeptide (TPR) repeat protein
MASLQRRRLALVVIGFLALPLFALGARGADVDDLIQKARSETDLESALKQYREIVRLTEKDTDRRRATVLEGLAELLRAAGAYGEAEGFYQQSLAVYRSNSPGSAREQDVARVLWQEGLLYSSMGRYSDAEKSYNAAFALLEAKSGSQLPNAPLVQSDLADLCRLEGRYDDAEQLFNKSLERLGESGTKATRGQRATTSLNLGALYQQEGRYDEAQRTLEASRQVFRELNGSADPYVAICDVNLGWVYYSRAAEGDLKQAQAYFEEGLRILEARYGSANLRVAKAQSTLGWLYHTLGQYDDAEHLYRSSLKTRTAKLPPDHPDLALSEYNLALLLGSKGKWDEAAAEMDQARQTLGRHVDHTLPYLTEAEQLDFLKTQQEQFAAALSLGFARREDARSAELSAEWLLNGKAMAHEVLAERALLARDSGDSHVRELADVRTQLATMTLVNAVPEELEQYKQRERELSREIGQASGKQIGNRAWVKMDAVRACLPANSVLVEVARFDVWDFQAHDKQRPGQALRYAAWVIPARGEGRVQIADLGPADRIDKAVDTVRAAMDAFPKVFAREDASQRDLEDKIQEPLGRLARLLYTPLEESLGARGRRWVISPDGKLWLVPWAMLPVGAKHYAVEDHAISYVVTGRDLVRDESKVQPGPALVMADPDFDLAPEDARAEAKEILGARAGQAPLALRGGVRSFDALHNFESLPGTRKDAYEAMGVLSRLTKDPQERLGKQALEQVFKGTRNPRFLVLSTHGWVLDQPKGAAVNPLLLCGLALAGANKRNAARGADEDGILTGLEITGADLRGTELVLLSACESGLGAVRDGEGVAGLRQAFQLAGAGTVVATLWQISDDVTPLLIRGYFDGLAAGHGKADALCEAQRSLITSRRKTYGAAHPFFWAAFTSTGKAD